MESVKTAVSIKKSLFQQAEELARTMRVSRSHLYGRALEDYLRRRENRRLLAEINEAYADRLDDTERNVLQKARRQHRRLVEGEW
jgi:predicted transcriptional regulator